MIPGLCQVLTILSKNFEKRAIKEIIFFLSFLFKLINNDILSFVVKSFSKYGFYIM
jgi:hypothetical protein